MMSPNDPQVNKKPNILIVSLCAIIRILKLIISRQSKSTVAQLLTRYSIQWALGRILYTYVCVKPEINFYGVEVVRDGVNTFL